MAQRGTDAGLRVLKVRKEAPLLVLELAVDALLLTPGRASMLPIERMLLAGIVLGPSVFGALWPHGRELLFPAVNDHTQPMRKELRDLVAYLQSSRTSGD